MHTVKALAVADRHVAEWRAKVEQRSAAIAALPDGPERDEAVLLLAATFDLLDALTRHRAEIAAGLPAAARYGRGGYKSA
jgi:hypothetical protein